MDTNKIQSPFQLIGNSIRKLSITNDIVWLNEYDQDHKLKRKFDVDYWIEEIKEYEEDASKLGTMTLQTRVLITNNLKQKFKINIEVQGCYAVPITTSDDAFKKLLSLNGCASLYTICRALVQSISAQALNGGSVLLPMVNVFRLNEEKQALLDSKR